MQLAHVDEHAELPTSYRKRKATNVASSSEPCSQEWDAELEARFFAAQTIRPAADCPISQFRKANQDSPGRPPRYPETVYWVAGTGWQGVTARYRDELTTAFPDVDQDFHLEKIARWLYRKWQAGKRLDRFNFHGLICYWFQGEQRYPKQPVKQVVHRHAETIARHSEVA